MAIMDLGVVVGDYLICRICGREFEQKMFYSPYDDICSSQCLDKNFWLEFIKEYISDPNLHAVINGKAYSIGEENVSLYCKGYDGRKFKIKKNDGTIIVTTNLWLNGDVPNEYRDKLKDDAEFIWSE